MPEAKYCPFQGDEPCGEHCALFDLERKKCAIYVLCTTEVGSLITVLKNIERVLRFGK